MKYVTYQKQDHVAEITLNRPEVMNAFNSQMLDELIRAFQMVEQDGGVYSVILSANGEKAFSAGGDIREEIATDGPAARAFGEKGKACVRAIERCRVPVICAVHGFTLGGGMELLLVCDMTVASEDARIGMPTIKLGTIPGWGCTKNLADVVGKYRAKELLLTGRMLSAREAYDLGLVEYVVPRAELLPKARELAETIADMAPIAVKAMKSCIDRGWQMSTEEAYAMETEAFSMCYDTQDKFEAMSAFLEKRPHRPYQYR
ncbi:MAG: enoyl-CoA hydratase/isomerase family protein [Evtepia sp.]|uniref:enoyl-CoA hydratase/isomerase family protein n=1 Tax=Evtepia sp. TaxID=2773933 RepID=UPI002A753B0E|nr:enoyl-CoA hydratase/isomerase family protein [Evtepia sp.]MDY3014595.1 enoyl-CoA hydratase/isomerase family protein [Evtepia sp.]